MTALFTKASSVSTHSHPKVAAIPIFRLSHLHSSFQHTATRRWLRTNKKMHNVLLMFQHTATRRWLQPVKYNIDGEPSVSTHSHPKVAAVRFRIDIMYCTCFNTQPPEGGCIGTVLALAPIHGFNTQPPEGGCNHNYYTIILL